MTSISADLYKTIHIIITALPSLLDGSLVTITTVLCALVLGAVIGLCFAIIQTYTSLSIIKGCISVYIWFFRGMPILLLLFLFYFGLFNLMSITISTIATACIVLGLASAAYQTQIFKSALKTIPLGQTLAAQSLGMTPCQNIFSIVLPQALRRSFPGITNEFSILLKDSALCFVLGTPELMAQTNFTASRTDEYLPLYITAGILYFTLTLIGVACIKKIETLMTIPGYTLSIQ